MAPVNLCSGPAKGSSSCRTAEDAASPAIVGPADGAGRSHAAAIGPFV